MKKFFVFMFILLGLAPGLYSKCINVSHEKAREVLDGGIKKEAKEYQCAIKASEYAVFDSNGNCKFCGCMTTDHDNT